nr:MAG TPA: hypothetical protein [Caudoviricetes sp.]
MIKSVLRHKQSQKQCDILTVMTRRNRLQKGENR